MNTLYDSRHRVSLFSHPVFGPRNARVSHFRQVWGGGKVEAAASLFLVQIRSDCISGQID